MVTDTARAQLAATFAAVRQIPVSDIAGTQPHDRYYAYDSATGSYWALGYFVPSRKAPFQVQWTSRMAVTSACSPGPRLVPGQAGMAESPAICAEKRFFPSAVMAAWSLPVSNQGIQC